MASALFFLLVIFTAVAAIPVLLSVFAVVMTKREHSEAIRPSSGIPTLWKIGAACFIAYLAMFFVLKLLLVAETFNHFYFPALYHPQLGSFSVVANSLLFALGIPIPFLFDTFARETFVHLSARHTLLLYLANGLLLSCLATYAFARLHKIKGSNANTNST